jgi:hypothetical protein
VVMSDAKAVSSRGCLKGNDPQFARPPFPASGAYIVTHPNTGVSHV